MKTAWARSGKKSVQERELEWSVRGDKTAHCASPPLLSQHACMQSASQWGRKSFRISPRASWPRAHVATLGSIYQNKWQSACISRPPIPKFRNIPSFLPSRLLILVAVNKTNGDSSGTSQPLPRENNRICRLDDTAAMAERTGRERPSLLNGGNMYMPAYVYSRA